jgi:hypothetical protein
VTRLAVGDSAVEDIGAATLDTRGLAKPKHSSDAIGKQSALTIAEPVTPGATAVRQKRASAVTLLMTAPSARPLLAPDPRNYDNIDAACSTPKHMIEVARGLATPPTPT